MNDIAVCWNCSVYVTITRTQHLKQTCALKIQIDQSAHLCSSDQCLNCPLIQCTILKATCIMKSKIIQSMKIWYLSHRRAAQMHTQSMIVDDGHTKF